MALFTFCFRIERRPSGSLQVEKAASNMTAKKTPEQKAESNPVGRPSKYDPAFCVTAMEIMGQGYSETVLAGEIGVCIDTITDWKKAHPEFSASVHVARAKGLRFWEDRLRHVAEKGGGPGTAQAVIFGLRNRAPESWSDTQRRELSGPNGGPIEHAADGDFLAVARALGGHAAGPASSAGDDGPMESGRKT